MFKKLFTVAALVFGLVFGATIAETATATPAAAADNFSVGANSQTSVGGNMIYYNGKPADLKSAAARELCLKAAKEPNIKQMCGTARAMKLVQGGGGCSATQGEDGWGKYVLIRYQGVDNPLNTTKAKVCGQWHPLANLK